MATLVEGSSWTVTEVARLLHVIEGLWSPPCPFQLDPAVYPGICEVHRLGGQATVTLEQLRAEVMAMTRAAQREQQRQPSSAADAIGKAVGEAAGRAMADKYIRRGGP